MTLEEMKARAEENTLVGQFSGISNEDYHKGPGLSSTGLALIGDTTPSHFQEFKKNPPEPTAAMIMGNAIHVAILEPELMSRYVTFLPESTSGNSKAAREEKVEFLERHKGMYILPSQEKFDDVRRIVDAVHANPMARNLLGSGLSEESFFAIDPETGELLKCRSDKFRPDLSLSINLKSTIDASFKQFQKDIVNYKYHWQSAFYIDVMETVLKTKIQEIHLVVEKASPYANAFYVLDDASLEKARDEFTPVKRIYSRCRRNNVWPGYPAEIQTMNLPHWAF